MSKIKYDCEFKVRVVEEYQNGKLGYRRLAKKHGVKSHQQIERWVKVYEKFGKEGLHLSESQKKYSVQFKLNVLGFIKKTGTSELDAALAFGLNHPALIGRWKRSLLSNDCKVFARPKGVFVVSNKNSDKKGKKKEVTYEQQLERENELLRLEVAYLKKLKAFQMDPDGYLEEHRRRYHSNSKKSSD